MHGHSSPKTARETLTADTSVVVLSFPMYLDTSVIVAILWAISLILLLTVILTVRVMHRSPGRVDSTAWFIDAVHRGIDELDVAIGGATEFNSFHPDLNSGDGVAFSAMVRLTPTKFEPVIAEVTRHIREGRIISLDLRKIERHQAGETG
jgi:hypothetical protein